MERTAMSLQFYRWTLQCRRKYCHWRRSINRTTGADYRVLVLYFGMQVHRGIALFHVSPPPTPTPPPRVGFTHLAFFSGFISRFRSRRRNLFLQHKSFDQLLNLIFLPNSAGTVGRNFVWDFQHASRCEKRTPNDCSVIADIVKNALRCWFSTFVYSQPFHITSETNIVRFLMACFILFLFFVIFVDVESLPIRIYRIIRMHVILRISLSWWSAGSD